MVMPIVLDIVVVVTILIAAIDGRNKGFIKMLWRVCSLLIALMTVVLLVNPITELVMDTDMAQNLISQLSSTVEGKIVEGNIDKLTPEMISEITNIPQSRIPDNISEIVLDSDAADVITRKVQGIAEDIAEIIVKIAVTIILFVLVCLVMTIIYHALNIASMLPIVNSLNRFLGTVLGIISIVVVLYIIVGCVGDNIEAGSQWDMLINDTYLVNIFYNNNILIN